jgi:hypothetical protein
VSQLWESKLIELRSEAALRERGEQLRSDYDDCPDCGRRLLVTTPLDDRIHPATHDARPLLLACELRPNMLAPHLAPRAGDGASWISYRCDWTRVVGWFVR